jgi:hypothetical protein
MSKSGGCQLYSCHFLGYWTTRYQQSYQCMENCRHVGLWSQTFGIRHSLRCLLDDADFLDQCNIEGGFETHTLKGIELETSSCRAALARYARIECAFRNVDLFFLGAFSQ